MNYIKLLDNCVDICRIMYFCMKNSKKYFKLKGNKMSYTSGTNYRRIKNFSGGRGVVSKLRSDSISKHSNVKSSSNSLSTPKNTSSNEVLIVELKTYSKIAQNSTQDIQKIGERLIASGQNSLFDKAEKSHSTKNVVREAKDFVNNYNNMLSSVTKLGGKENKEFILKLKEYAEENVVELKNVGITVLKDGSLSMNRNQLSAAILEDLKKAFNGKDSFADKVINLSIEIEKNVENKLKENLEILGKGMNSPITSSGSSSRNFFNVSV